MDVVRRWSVVIGVGTMALALVAGAGAQQRAERARDLGVPFEGTPGGTVPVTGLVRSGITAILPRGDTWHAIDTAATGTPAEGNVGGGTDMECFGFKGGSGTASRVLPASKGGYTVGVFVQCASGRRSGWGAWAGPRATGRAISSSPFRP